VSGRSLGTELTVAATLAAPIANLVLASGALGAVLILLRVDVELLGTALFGLYSLGLLVIYGVLRPALRLLGFSRHFQAAVLPFGIGFFLFLGAYLT